MVCSRTRRWPTLQPAAFLSLASLSLVALIVAGAAQAQVSEPAPETERPAAAPTPRRLAPKPKPKPAPKPAVKPAAEAPATTPTDPKPVATPAPVAAPAPMPAANLPGLTVQCEARAAVYEGQKDFVVWVTRTGAVVVENPLRPLTPETTRVLEVVIAGKAATAYGPDLFALRRGGSPAALGALLGAPVRWDAVPAPLPDTLNIVSDTGKSLAQLGFRECGEAPAVTRAPVAAGNEAAKPSKTPVKRVRPKVAKESGSGSSGAKAPPGLSLPQGAIE
ncbi:hypothetical protein [Methylobacterium sp. Leaf88]|uniref:hypothetical protein n=1 Tax=Methylobacterium sp. Leaf88 TaxID=1736244 RepID=UPI000B2C246B|nr:hypothetical protein [Methylobacterium sp. Leaf88]